MLLLLFYLTLTVFVWPGNCSFAVHCFGGQFILKSVVGVPIKSLLRQVIATTFPLVA